MYFIENLTLLGLTKK